MIVLASASPRRERLLRDAGLRFVVEPSDAREELGAETDPEAGARELALRKALAVAARHGPADWIIGADTIVAVPVPGGGERMLGKPDGADEARSMLEGLSGTRHRVVTGVAVVRGGSSREEGSCGAETTWVSMRPITPREIEAYVASGEWRGKAGGDAIQETADRFVVGLEGGGFDNVVGLPVALTLELLRAAGAERGDLPPASEVAGRSSDR